MFENAEFADMHYMYGLADGNAFEARRLYAERFPQRIVPDARTFSSVHRRLREKGCFKPDHHLKGHKEPQEQKKLK